MRLTKVKLYGYKRLLDTSCNVDADLIALLGPNEAGKTSVLEALHWLTNGGRLPNSAINRTMDPELLPPVVTATYSLEEDDQNALSSIATDTKPQAVKFYRFKNGRAEIKFTPSLTRPKEPSEAVLEELGSSGITPHDENDEILEKIKSTNELAKSGDEFSAQEHRDINSLIEWLEKPLKSSSEESPNPDDAPAPKADIDAAQVLKVWQKHMSERHPEQIAVDVIQERIPQFLLFTESDRTLGFEYDLELQKKGGGKIIPSDDVSNPPQGLVNLLSVGRTTIRELADLVDSGDAARTLGKLRTISDRLSTQVASYWKQRDLKVLVNLDGLRLQIFVEEGTDTARFTDRSDGLRSFIALIAFLEQHQTDPPPILLIDEADMHLHYNAQADLINRLQSISPVRTIYTTHSPGCLPLDLGTGIRIIRPNPEPAVSALSNNFWESNDAGFTPLLFAMGASAAAFSALRNAVFTEGPSDMILLPSLIRTAIEKPSLEYQVVPGISSLPPDRLGEITYEAARIAYLLDGDQGGETHRKHLQCSGVPENRIFSLPPEHGIEDLIEPEAYLETVNTILEESGESERVSSQEIQNYVDDGKTIAKAVEIVLGEDKAIGKTIIANRLVNKPNGESVPLIDSARQYLCDLHSQLQALFHTN